MSEVPLYDEAMRAIWISRPEVEQPIPIKKAF
jgi:hypothetical protein